MKEMVGKLPGLLEWSRGNIFECSERKTLQVRNTFIRVMKRGEVG